MYLYGCWITQKAPFHMFFSHVGLPYFKKLRVISFPFTSNIT